MSTRCIMFGRLSWVSILQLLCLGLPVAVGLATSATQEALCTGWCSCFLPSRGPSLFRLWYWCCFFCISRHHLHPQIAHSSKHSVNYWSCVSNTLRALCKQLNSLNCKMTAIPTRLVSQQVTQPAACSKLACHNSRMLLETVSCYTSILWFNI